MIPKATIDEIFEAAHVEEVVGEFVTLKKRGANYLGLCPFHGEKSPSFTVSAVKGIYKCFGCGKAGNSVNFVMEHLQLTYPEALKWLANKYGIEVVEKEFTPEEKEKKTERESMLIVMQYAQRYFSEIMMNSDEGRSVGYSYFIERELRPEIISKFQLGYSLEAKNAFTIEAAKKGYAPKYLAKTGMSILSNRYQEGNEITVNDLFDRYSGRVMFPIQDDGGRVVAFGGRTLSADKKIAKYINSPETEIYNKSKILYGLWLGKKSIQNNDTCYLVEGYMDVIAMHQAGIENVVASSGTSLTIDQIKSIHRFTKNIVVLYDGDDAGQKASNRAIPLLLEEGMNVRLLLFPSNDDPDSFSRKVSNDEFHSYIKNNTKDFLIFKAQKLKTETENDPIKKANVIKDIVENIALIPDTITRSIYTKECANIMELAEIVLQSEINKIRKKSVSKTKPTEDKSVDEQFEKELEDTKVEVNTEDNFKFDAEEKELLRLLLKYGNVEIKIEVEDEENKKQELDVSLAAFIIHELKHDGIAFENPLHQLLIEEYIAQLSNQNIPNIEFFIQSADVAISSFVINNFVDIHELSQKWITYGVEVASELADIKKGAQHVLFSLKEKILNKLILEKRESLKNTSPDNQDLILIEIKKYNELKIRVNKLLGRVVIK